MEVEQLGLWIDRYDGGAGGADNTAPAVDALSIYYDPATSGLGIRVMGNDEQSNVLRFELSLLDENDQDVLLANGDVYSKLRCNQSA